MESAVSETRYCGEKNVLKWVLWFAWFLGFMAFAFSAMTLFGYWAAHGESQPLADWGPGPGMALNTAICLLLLASSTMILAQAGLYDIVRYSHVHSSLPKSLAV